MSGWINGYGVHFALTDQQSEQLLSLMGSREEMVEFIQGELEEPWDEGWLCETDQVWNLIHRCLTDGTLSTDNSSPRYWCVLNGRRIFDGECYIVSYLTASQVQQVYDAIVGITQAEFRSGYNQINSTDVEEDLSDDTFDSAWAYFLDLRAFYERAAEAKRSVIFTADE